jgi:hypothetical protein
MNLFASSTIIGGSSEARPTPTKKPGLPRLKSIRCKACCFLKIISLPLYAALVPLAAHGQASVTLAWSAPTSGSSVAGYRIYYGNATKSYTSAVSVGKVTQATLSGMDPAATYYIALTAFDAAGNESDFSNEINFSDASSSGRPNLVLKVNPSHQASISGKGKASHAYEVQASLDLKQWTVLGNVTTDTSGSFIYTDPNSASIRSRSYRLRDPSP